MKVVITGGSGFIGCHLCEKFLADGFEVVAIDNFVTGRKSNITHLLDNKKFTFIEHDVVKPFDVDGDVKYVLHFACPASPIDFDKIPLEIMHVDSIGTFNALELALKKKARFIIASTSEIYGDPEVHPQKETYWGNVNSIGYRSCYDEAKRFSEAATMTYKRKYGLDVGIVRIFNTYGPRMRLDDGRVVPNLASQALQNLDMTVYGEGKQTRSFCYVDDLVEGIFRLTKSNFQEPVNIGNPSEYTINDFAKLIIKLTGAKSKITYAPLPHDDPKQRKPDITRAKEILKWEPKVSVEEGLRRTIEEFKKELKM